MKYAPNLMLLTAILALGARAEQPVAPAVDADAKVRTLEEKVKSLERRIADLEAERKERPAPLKRFDFQRGDPNAMPNDMLEKIEKFQRELLNGGLDKFMGPDGFDMDLNFDAPRRPQARKPRMGVELDPVTDELKERFKSNVKEGAFVRSVVPNTPADRAGLQTGDAITHFDGKAVSDPQVLIRAVQNAAKGSHELKISRHGEELKLKVELGAEIADAAGPGALLENDGWLRRGDGANNGQTRTELKVSALELSGELAKDLKLSDEQKKKVEGVLSKHQTALNEDVAGNNGGFKRRGAFGFNLDNRIDELAQKHTDAAAKDLKDVLSAEQFEKWNDYRKSHSSISFSQTLKMENFGGPGEKPREKEKETTVEKF